MECMQERKVIYEVDSKLYGTLKCMVLVQLPIRSCRYKKGLSTYLVADDALCSSFEVHSTSQLDIYSAPWPSTYRSHPKQHVAGSMKTDRTCYDFQTTSQQGRHGSLCHPGDALRAGLLCLQAMESKPACHHQYFGKHVPAF